MFYPVSISSICVEICEVNFIEGGFERSVSTSAFIGGLNEVTKGHVFRKKQKREIVSKYVRMLLCQPLST